MIDYSYPPNTRFGFYNIIICGSREFNDYEFVKHHIDRLLKKIPNRDRIQIVSGCGRGVDTLGIRYSEEVLGKRPMRFKPDYKSYPDKVAPIVRNELMAQYSSHCIAFWNGETNHSGTYDMIKRAQNHNLVLRVIKIGE